MPDEAKIIKSCIYEIFKKDSGLVFPNYLIEKEKPTRFIIHRELQNNELVYYTNSEVFEYKGKLYLKEINSGYSEEEAKNVIEGYWGEFSCM
ncbi:hypothetical protein B4102_2188 [Heyndrickxia sporothermodurans]|uniref:Uncharacterized protein n=1 Tax=Heyndrickxia sporothermodurans TaxID=46224 RepID=A0A150LGU0_9BACI|nr:hypothetical protein [Heyndrickxia sporothermodurans]KYD11460.1 hypothetical protein B4102_2188 [Heyndrickxia sporothermodurans]